MGAQYEYGFCCPIYTIHLCCVVQSRSHILLWKVKGKDHSFAGHEGPEGEKGYSSTLSLTSLDGVGGQCHAPAALRDTHNTECWVGPGPVWTSAENHPHPPTGIPSPDRPARSDLCFSRSVETCDYVQGTVPDEHACCGSMLGPSGWLW